MPGMLKDLQKNIKGHHLITLLAGAFAIYLIYRFIVRTYGSKDSMQSGHLSRRGSSKTGCFRKRWCYKLPLLWEKMNSLPKFRVFRDRLLVFLQAAMPVLLFRLVTYCLRIPTSVSTAKP